MKREEIIAAGGAHCDAGFVTGIIGSIDLLDLGSLVMP